MTTPIVAYALTGLALPVALSATTVLHELGHYAAACAAGVRVYEFTIGRGKILWSWKRGDTRFRVRALPFWCRDVVSDWATQQQAVKRKRPSRRRSPARTSFEAKRTRIEASIDLAGIGVNTAIGLSVLLVLLLLWLQAGHAHVWNVPPFGILLLYIAKENLWAAGTDLMPLPGRDGAHLLRDFDAAASQGRGSCPSAKTLEVVSRSCQLIATVLVIALDVLLVQNLQALLVQPRVDTIAAIVLILIVLTLPSGSPKRQPRQPRQPQRAHQPSDMPGRRGSTRTPKQRVALAERWHTGRVGAVAPSRATGVVGLVGHLAIVTEMC